MKNDELGVRQALAYSMAGKYATLVIQLVSTMVIARLLSPQEIGIYSVGAAAVAVAHILREFGISSYLIQERELTKERIGTAFTITLIIGWVLGGMIVFSSPFVSRFYGEPGLVQVLGVIAFNFFIIPFGSVSMALLRREMRFISTFWISLASAVSHASVGIAMAWFGFGFMSLAWAGFAGVVTTVIGSLIALPRQFLSPPTLSERKHVFSFGSQIGLAGVANEVAYAAPDLILGKVLGFTSLGYFNRALGFVQIFDRIILDGLRPVVLPYFSREKRREKSLRDAYCKSLEYILGVSWPSIAVLALLAAPLIRILYGDQWDNAVPIAYVLCAMVAIRSIGVLTGPILIAHGAANIVLKISLGSLLVCIVVMIFSVQFGLMAFAGGMIISYTISIILQLYFLNMHIKIQFQSIVKIFIKSLFITILICTSVILFSYLLEIDLGSHSLSFVKVFLMMALSLVTWIFCIVFFKNPIYLEFLYFYKKYFKK